MYRLKKAWFMFFGWWYAGWGKHCWYGRRVDVLLCGKTIGGLVVIDHRNGPTVILRDDGTVQRGGVFRPAK